MASNEIDLTEFQQTPSKSNFKEFLKGGVYGIGSVPMDLVRLLAAPENIYKAGKQFTTGEEQDLSGFTSTINDWGDSYDRGLANLLSLEIDDYGTPASDAGDAAYILSQFALPGGVAVKAAAKAPKIAKIGAELVDTVLSRGKNKYLTAGAMGVTGALAFDNPAQGASQTSLSSSEVDLSEFGDAAPSSDIDLSEFQQPEMDLSEFRQPVVIEKEGSVVRDTLKYGAPALAGIATAVFLHRALTKAGVRNRLNTVSGKFGINDVETLTPKSTQLKQGWLDRNASVKEVYADVNPDKAKEFDALVDVGQATGAVETMFTDFARTGKIIGSDITVPRMTDVYSKVGALSPEQQKLLSEALDAGDRLSNIKYRGFADGDPIQHRFILDSAKADPQIAPIIKDMKLFYDGMAKYIRDQGLIGDDFYKLVKQDDFMYLPEYTASTPQKFGEKFIDFVAGTSRELKPATSVTSLFKRGDPLPENVKRLNPLDSMEQYALSMIDYAHANKIRRDFADTMLTLGKANSRYKKLLTIADDPAKADMRVYRNGAPTYYNVGDQTIKNALQFAPQRLGVFLGTMNRLRQIKQATTTGKFRPTQAIRSAIYDIWTGANVSPSALGNYIRKQEGPTFGLFPGDFVTTIPNILGRGLWENAKGRIADNASRLLVDSVNRSGLIADLIGPERAVAVSNKLADYYSDSALSMFRRVGASSLGNYHDISTARGLRTMMNQIDNHLSGHPNSARLIHFYDGLLESIHNSVRLGFFAKNYSKLASKEPDLARLYELSRQTRQLTGDPGIQGGGELARILGATVPYYNIGLQTVRRMVKAFQERPVETSGALLTSTVLPAFATARFMSEDEDTRDWFWNELSPYERTSNLFIPSGDGSPPLSITLPNELRPFYAMSLAWADTLFGFSNGAIMSDEARPTRDEMDSWLGVRNSEDLITSIRNASPLTTQGVFESPITSIPLMMGNKKFAPDGSIIDLAPKQVGGPGANETNVPGDLMSAQMEELLRSMFGIVARDGLNLLNSAFGSYRDSQSEIAAFDAATDQYSLDVGSRFPIVGYTMFPDTKRKALDTVDSRVLYDKLDGIKRIQEVVTEDIRQANILQSGDYKVGADWIGKNMADPRLIGMFQTANAMASDIMGRMNHISNIRDQYKAVQANYKMAVDDKAKLQNKLALHILALEQQVNMMIRDTESLLEDQLWQEFGMHKRVRLEQLNKDTALEQLPDR